MKARYRILIGVLAVLAAALFVRLLVGHSVVALLAPQGTIASHERNVMIVTVVLMLAVAVPMIGTLFAFAWKYREGNRDAKYEPDRPHDPRREIWMWAVPACLIAVLGVLSWGSTHRLDPYASIKSARKPITIEAVALRWKWLFIYPDQGIATVNFLEIPEKTPVNFKLTADGPMSSFWIPQLGSQIYAMAAMQTKLSLEASSTGTYVGKDTEINGAGYAGMSFNAVSVTRTRFDDWVRSVKGSSLTLDRQAYAGLVPPTTYVAPKLYGKIDPTLYGWILTKDMMPGMYRPGDDNPNIPSPPSGGTMRTNAPASSTNEALPTAASGRDTRT